jgi:hypothetical protein
MDFEQFTLLLRSFRGSINVKNFLKERGYLDEKLNPTMEYLKMDFFRIVETNVTAVGTKSTYFNRVFITKKGMLSIISRILNHRMRTEKYVI